MGILKIISVNFFSVYLIRLSFTDKLHVWMSIWNRETGDFPLTVICFISDPNFVCRTVSVKCVPLHRNAPGFSATLVPSLFSLDRNILLQKVFV